MAAPTSKSSRLSSFFSLGPPKDEPPAPATPPPPPPSHSRGSSDGFALKAPQTSSRLSKSSSNPNLPSSNQTMPMRPMMQMPPRLDTEALPPLAPPPTLVNHGPPRPASSQGSVGSRRNSRPGSRTASREGSRSRPSTPTTLNPYTITNSPVSRPQMAPKDIKVAKRQSWMPRKPVPEEEVAEPRAWVAGLKEHLPYDSTAIFEGIKMIDIWNDAGDTFIYLFPRKSGKGPSFKIASALFSGSRMLLQLSRSNNRVSRDVNRLSIDSRGLETAAQRLSIQDKDGHLSTQGSARGRSNSSTASSGSMRFGQDFPDEEVEDRHLHLQLEFEADMTVPNARLTSNDMELLVLYRNFFAFLSGGALVATQRQSSLYAIFLGIGTILTKFDFTNLDGSTFGEVVSSSFARYCDELRLADVRASREKTIEAIVLGERMKSWSLYNEGFVHGTGKLSHMKSLNSTKYNQISPTTCNRLERAAIDLEGRTRTVETKLADFDFPSLFSGIANSQMAIEAKMVRFKAWKTAFTNMRKHVIAFYRQRYGSWPPKAKSKKNSFEESGLNRLLLNQVYQDFTDLYDMLVDRTQLTNRKIDMAAPEDDFDFNDTTDSLAHALRRIESEYDRATPPVQPPIPFDTPIFPSFPTSFHRGHTDPAKDAKDRARRMRENEVNELLLGSYNRESVKPSPFIEDYLHMERRAGRGCTIDEIADTRCGQWLFTYAVLQSLPMCVVDARDVRFSEGVEYFLCVPPRGGRPWLKEDTSQSRSWYNVASGGGIVSLPTDMIDHSVEGIYRRSHCWEVAAKWAAASETLSPATQISLGASLPPPPVVGGRVSTHYSPQLSPGLTAMRAPPDTGSTQSLPLNNRQSKHFSFGLEALPLPPGVSLDGRPLSVAGGPGRPANVHDPTKTFDSILGAMPNPTTKKGKK